MAVATPVPTGVPPSLAPVGDAVSLSGVTKTFGKTTAIRNLNLAVRKGSITGFIGPNGAGKTTTIRLILSILFPDAGSISVLGHPSALEAKDHIGYLPEERGLYRKMRVGAFLRYMARLKGVPEPEIKRRVGAWLERVGLGGEVERKKCEELSKGMQQKVGFLAAILHEPDLIVLDEPFSGMDPVNMRLLRDLIREQHERGATILFSTHVMFQAEDLCDHIIMINGGDKVLDGTLDEIRARSTSRKVLFAPFDPSATPASLAARPEVLDVRPGRGAWEVTLREGISPAVALPALAAAVPPARLELHRPSLEDIFVEIVAASAGASQDEETRLRASLRTPDGDVR